MTHFISSIDPLEADNNPIDDDMQKTGIKKMFKNF